jgi:thioredoxin reductase
MERVDVVIVGGGPAGLSAALILGRCRRSAVVVDDGHPRNARAPHMHGFLSRDGTPPLELLALARRQLETYPTIRCIEGRVVDARPGFEVTLEDGRLLVARKLLLASGVVDLIPPIPGMTELFGTSVFHCPYCDGWEVRDQPLAVYGSGTGGYRMALEITLWSHDLVLLTDGRSKLRRRHRDRLERNGVGLVELPVERLEGREGRLERIHFRNGDALERQAIFLAPRMRQASDLSAQIGCELTRRGVVKTGRHASTCVPGVYVAGDASRDIQLAIIAAAEGAQAAFAINTALLEEELK